jgi:hypothetical protein
LLQEKVNLMLDGWLQSLHEQGGVKILDPTVLPAGLPEGTSREATSSM